MDRYNAPLPQVSTGCLTCHSFSGISLGETRGRETSGPEVKRRDKGQGQVGGNLGENTRPRAKEPQRHIQRGRTPRWVRRDGERKEDRVGRVTGEAWPRRQPRAGDRWNGTRVGVGVGAGGDGEPGSPPPARPGPPADSAPRRPWPRPRLTVREAAPVEAAGEGTGGGDAATEAAAPAGGSGAEGPSRGRRGLRLQRTETAGVREQCAGAMRPPLSARAGRGQSTRRFHGNWAARGGQPLPLTRPGNGGGRCGRQEQSL